MIRRLAIVLLIGLPIYAQAPHEKWRTVTTAHFRIHYPVQYEAWAMRAASRIESVRDTVVREVGYSPKSITDVLVVNPIADPNGITIPILSHPRIVLFAEPPDPEVAIGEFSEWVDLLTVHEMTHLVHLLRPSRNPLQRLAENFLPLNPITLGAPRWVLEGYATVVEGRITGSGRPNSSIRASILRKWAISGRLPSYSQLSSDRRFLGMSMAYLGGSAFLEWLEERSGPDSLKHLWARMTARQKRSFNAAFEGVFGDSPERLYGKFTAELTERAMEVQRVEAASLREGELWQETSRGTGDPAVSPDGSKLALVERNDRGESKLVILSTGPNEEEKKFEERIAKMLKKDPEDVAPVRTKPLPRKPMHTLKPADGGDIMTPRWTRDGSAVIYTHRQPDRDGFLHDDLFLWRPETGERRRVTTLADVKEADPLPDGTHAIAVRSRFGSSQLVKVDLLNGSVEATTEPSLERIYSHPRAKADGSVAWAEHTSSGWRVQPFGVENACSPEWGKDGALYAAVAGRGFIEIARVDGGVKWVTRTTGAASQPAPSPDGSIFFMSMEPDGFVVRHIAPSSDVLPPLAFDRPLVPALPPDPAKPVVFAAQDLPPARDYGIGRLELGFPFGGVYTAYGHSKELGLRLGDVVGRVDLLAMGSTGSRSADRGAALAVAWRGWPIDVIAHGFTLRDRRGVELRGEYEHHAAMYVAHLASGVREHSAFAIGSVAFRQRQTGQSGSVAFDSKHHARGSLRLAARAGDVRFAISGEAARRIALGGFASSVVPDSLLIERVLDPALPAGFASAERYRGARAEIVASGLTFFWQRHDVRDRKVDVRGIELTMSAPPIPLLRSAGVDFTAGAAKVTNLRGTKGWIALRWRP